MDEILIVGGGPAGLTAALYLARFRRRVRVIDDGRSRALLAPLAHNVPGFPDGIEGHVLLSRMRAHARRYGAELFEGRVVQLSQQQDGGFAARLADGTRLLAQGVILAAGVEMRRVALNGGDHDAAVRAGVLRYCPICDGFEQSDANIAVLGSDRHGAAEAMFLRQFSERVSLIPQAAVALSASQRADLVASNIAVIERRVSTIRQMGNTIAILLDGEAAPRRFDILYPALGAAPRTELARQLGIEPETDGGLAADAFAEPLVPGLFAAGDVLSGLDQISAAAGQGAIAATRLHNWLRAQQRHSLSAEPTAD